MNVSEQSFITLTLVVVTFIGCLFMAAIDAEATTQDDVGDNPYGVSNYLFPGSYNFVHTKDDYIVVPFVNLTGELRASYKRETTDDWNYTQIASSIYDGNTGPWRVLGAVSTSNGSVCIGAVINEGATYYDEVYLFTKFSGDDWDEWDEVQIIHGTWHYYGAMSINDTDTIMFGLRMGGSAPYNLYYETFDFENYQLGHSLGIGQSKGETINAIVSVPVNMTGSFHFVWQGNDNYFYYRDHDETLAKTKIDTSTTYQVRDAQFLNNDMLVAAGQAGIDYIYYWYQSNYEGAFTRLQITANYRTWSYGPVLMTMDSSTTVRVATFEADADVGYVWGSFWNGTEGQWQASEQDGDFPDATYIRPLGGCRHTWPQDGDGRMWATVKSGWAFIGWDEDGSPDDFAIWWNGTAFWGDLTNPAPVITTASLPDATYDQFYSQTLSSTGGTVPLTWTLLVGPLWMSIGPSNGTLYGTPDATGSETVKVRLSDDIPRIDEAEWTLTIKPASSGTSTGEATSFSIDEMGELWILLAFTAALVGVARSYKKIVWRKSTR